ncbi:MAG: hypothetical protein PVF83_19060 [Anaerolineales bacterium]|jgi:hypothetical protein
MDGISWINVETIGYVFLMESIKRVIDEMVKMHIVIAGGDKPRPYNIRGNWAGATPMLGLNGWRESVWYEVSGGFCTKMVR